GYTVTETLPSGYLSGKDTVGSQGGTTGTNTVTGVVVTSGMTDTGYNFGDLVPSTLSGTVFTDTNNNGTKDTGEAAITGATVTLTGTNDLGAAVSLTATTDVNGAYTFTGLRPSTGYTVTETLPSGYLGGKDTAGNAGGTTGTNTVTGIVVNSGSSDTGYTFGDLVPSTLSGTVFTDTNNNGTKDAGEAAITGATVTL